MEVLEGIIKMISEKMIVKPSFCDLEIEGVKTRCSLDYAITKGNKELYKKPGVMSFDLCMPLAYVKKKIDLNQTVPQRITINKKDCCQQRFKLEPVKIEVETNRPEKNKYSSCYLRLPTKNINGVIHLVTDYSSVVENLAKDIYYLFAEPKLSEEDKFTKMQRFTVNAEVNADIKKFIGSFDGFGVTTGKYAPHIFSYKGFEKYGIEDDVEYAHFDACFFRLPQKNLFDINVKKHLDEMMNRKRELLIKQSEENQ